jgi:sigma-B regulation protein RsbU (phosphoserine phosphatase)
VLIGMIPGFGYRSARVDVPPGASLYLFSDGVFEVEPANGRTWGMDDFVALLAEPRDPGKVESRRILEAVMARTGQLTFEDDFTLVVAAFA